MFGLGQPERVSLPSPLADGTVGRSLQVKVRGGRDYILSMRPGADPIQQSKPYAAMDSILTMLKIQAPGWHS